MAMNVEYLSAAQHQAVKRLAEAGGEGVIDRYGRMIGAGEVLKNDASTWLRLVTYGVVAPAAPNRIALTELGWRMNEAP